MNEWIWMAAMGAAFGAGSWWGHRKALRGVARMIAAGLLAWRPGTLDQLRERLP